MADAKGRRGRFEIRLAQLLLVVTACALWAASRLPWVVIRSFDGLGQPRQITISGASWSTALPPLAMLSLAAAIAAVAVRGWPLRVLVVLVAVASLAAGYLAVSMWVIADVTVRGADIAGIPLASLVGGDRHYAGAALTLAAALCVLVAAALLMRSAASGAGSAAKYVAPAARRSTAQRDGAGPGAPGMSERMIWDALDDGCDLTDEPTDGAAGPAAEGR
jgi:uncharacterized membrane protein (TIGR02234 family)